ncbi:hypothetical protein RV11_GL001689 [Enterococcus phoeniculicola]|jgi:predicted transcriptional regulator|uniref:HTH cro/C1-type domain-containing protein n=1 Tax=Enterococcus phoeniculicola ATCC BAA-412 TaxID=1158610 RepID=R3W423_9ENTE|nr:hypothetical protein [Enterococcus phoeniculicola]EOL42256.1 hypothetical protein UC3_02607 [Enterococcus phoeniculicola ATCC BAA-412]EOT79465.1 hypothetical protein I589_00974 [Enterococcus phoeniculicola ATCC BAA-412]OJG70176.1 hypothetical protein RV11_GL001689 [Enterococcus phoeniculicola]
MKINLKKYVDETGLSLTELSKKTAIPYDSLIDMYAKDEFDEHVLGVTHLTNLMIAFDLTNINLLVPEMK